MSRWVGPGLQKDPGNFTEHFFLGENRQFSGVWRYTFQAILGSFGIPCHIWKDSQLHSKIQQSGDVPLTWSDPQLPILSSLENTIDGH